MNRWIWILRSSLVAGVAVQPLLAQTLRKVVVPKWSPVKDALHWIEAGLGPDPTMSPTHVQYGYDVNDFGMGAALFRSLAVRSTGFRDNPAMRLRTTVALSHGPRAANGLSQKWAQNEGSDRTVVFSGTLNWPATKISQGMKFVGVVPFARNFLFRKTAGKSLVVDARATRVSSSPPPIPWAADAAMRDVGGGRFNQIRNCWLGRVLFYYASAVRGVFIGGAFDYRWYSIPRSAQCVSSIGFKGVGSRWGSLMLPIDMTPLGAPGCYWAAASEIFLPFTTDASGNGKVPTVPIPNIPALAGKKFYEQSGCAVPTLNALGLVTFFSVEFTIGSGSTPQAGTLLGQRDSPPRALADTYWKNRGPIMQFTY